MQHFKDAVGRDWSIAVTVKTFEAVKDRLKLDLADLFGEEGDRILSDPIKLCNLLFVVCADEAKAKGVTDEQFGQGLVGDPIEHATDAMLEAIADFFPSRKRNLMKAMLAKSREISQAGAEMAIEKINKIDPSRLFKSAMNLPGSSDATPPTSRSDNSSGEPGPGRDTSGPSGVISLPPSSTPTGETTGEPSEAVS